MSDPTTLRARAGALHLHGLLAHWSEVATADWVAALLDWEEQERRRRSLERRLKDARIGRFKPICDFDWGLAQTLRSRGRRSADDTRVPGRRRQCRPGRPQRRRQVDAGPEYRPSGLDRRAYRLVHQRRP